MSIGSHEEVIGVYEVTPANNSLERTAIRLHPIALQSGFLIYIRKPSKTKSCDSRLAQSR
jgi:hypothetical protein